MSNIRVLIHDTPTLLKSILEDAITGQSDMEVIAAPVPVDRPSVSLPPDVVIVGGEHSQPAASARILLTRWPHACVLMITSRGRRILMYQLRPHSKEFGEMSPIELIQAIRTAVTADDHDFEKEGD